MSSGKRNARNLAINWSSFLSTGALLFFLSPFVIRSLGPIEYGIWSLLNVLAGYMGVLDLGIRASTGRHIFLYIGRGDHQSVDETIRTSLGFFSAVGLLIVAVGAMLGWVFPMAFSSVPDGYRSLLLWLVPLMAVNVWMSAIATVFSSVLLAHERFDSARGVDVCSLITRAVVTVVVLKLGYGIVGLVSTVVVSNLLALSCNAWLAKQLYPRLRFGPLLLKRSRLRELGGYGLAAFISTTAVKIVGQTDLVIVGTTIGMAAVTRYAVGALLVYYSVNLLSQIAGTFQPSLQKAVARGEMGAARWIFFRQVRLANLIGIPMYVGFISYAEPFIRLWMLGPKFDESSVHVAAMVMKILAASKLIGLFCSGSTSLLNAMGHVRLTAALSICQACANLGVSLLFVIFFGWGLAGVALGTLVCRLMLGAILLPWYACCKGRINWWNYVADIGGKGLASSLLFACWCLVAQSLIPCETWLKFALSVALAIIGYLPLALLILLPAADRTRAQNKLRLLLT